MKRLTIAVALLVSQAFSLPAQAQTKLTPKGAATVKRADDCAPIGRTANGELVYSMKCENLPAPQASSQPASSPQAQAKETAPPEPEVRRSGLFGLSYEVKRPDQ